jgi:hypothetical protein
MPIGAARMSRELRAARTWASAPGEHDAGHDRPYRPAAQVGSGQLATDGAHAEHRPVEAEQGGRSVQVEGHVHGQGHLERTVEQVEDERPGEQAAKHRDRPPAGASFSASQAIATALIPSPSAEAAAPGSTRRNTGCTRAG